jgi:tRNA1Val (adenine37-N6)-methyltransferase
MGNDYFQFKQFRIRQQKTAMRVTTDACLFGAWVAERFPTAGRVLDMGSGTGLLMLMLAQRMPGMINGIEIEEDAFQEAEINLAESPWGERLSIVFGDIRTFRTDQRYDLIISNPPFFHGDLKRVSNRENIAMHGTALSLLELTQAIARLLTSDGIAAILVPPHRSDELTANMSEHGLFEREELIVRHSLDHPVLRNVLVFTRHPAGTIARASMDIRDQDGIYTQAFTSLLKPYYLNL